MRITFNKNPIYIGFRVIDTDWLDIRNDSGQSINFTIVSDGHIIVSNVEVGTVLTINYEPRTIFNYNVPVRQLLNAIYEITKWVFNKPLGSSVAIKPAPLGDFGDIPDDLRTLESQVYITPSGSLGSEAAVGLGRFLPAGSWAVGYHSNIYVAVDPAVTPVVINHNLEEQTLTNIGTGVYQFLSDGGSFLVCFRTQ